MDQLLSWIESGDRRIFQLVNHQMRCPVFNRWMPKITHLGGFTFSMGLLLALFFLVEDEDVMFEALNALIVSHMLVQVGKRSCSRRRPYLKEGLVHVVDRPLKDYSFPSGHSAAVFAWCTAIAFAIPWLAPFLFTLAIFVGISRMYLGLHYPLDVLVGAVLGMSCSIAVHFW